ncbi:MAG: hypothetical protein KC535_02530 [Nanoarchaeota archaeon]|nr:hypothetical protein [Nanoarchaeota archaeon]
MKLRSLIAAGIFSLMTQSCSPPPGFEQYSISAAQQDSLYMQETPVLQEYLINKLSTYDHISRPKTDYSEDYLQIYSVSDKVLLSLLKQYVDYFGSLDQEDFTVFFPEVHNEEKGGAIIYDVGVGVELFENTSDLDQGKYNSYSNKILPYISKLGVFHTHPLSLSVDNPSLFSLENQRTSAGPSGSARLDIIDVLYYSDFHTFRASLLDNRYYIDAVITELTPSSYDIDIYFHNPKDPKRVITVIDVRKYDFID